MRRLRFTKMHGAGNDFVVIDATREPMDLEPEQMRRLGDRRLGVGADQILVVERARDGDDADFGYRIWNGGSGDEVEQCGNGARCFARFVRDRGLTSKSVIVARTMNRRLELRVRDDGRVTVDMGAPDFEPAHVPFDDAGLTARGEPVGGSSAGAAATRNDDPGRLPPWPLDLPRASADGDREGEVPERIWVGVCSMGNPHAVQVVDDVDRAPVARQGPLIERHRRFPQGVNAGFLQVVSRRRARLRVHERGAGETLACGSGACAAVAVGIRLGLLDSPVDVETRGGVLTIEWDGPPATVRMTGPAETVYEGEIEL